MTDAAEGETGPTRARKVIATIIVIVTLLAVWKFIDYRTQPPPPPNPVGVTKP